MATKNEEKHEKGAVGGILYTITPTTPPDGEAGPSDGLGPYQDVYLAASPSDYTVDSQFEFAKGNTYKEEELRHALRSAGIEADDDLRDCGIRQCRPSFLQPCARVKVFLGILCVLSTISGSLVGGYLNSVITTIEKRFEIGSSFSGFIAASVEVGSLVSVIFVSYLGGGRRIPVWIGCGAILQGLGALFFTLPHVIAESYTVTGGIVNDTEENVCKAAHRSTPVDDNSAFCLMKGWGGWAYVMILIVAQVMIGTGGSPLYTLGTTYIDNHVSKDKAPAYIAFIYAFSALGPVLGFALGALMLQYYVDIFTVDISNLGLTPDDPRWVGAWWAGFLVCGGMLIIFSLPFFAFPKHLRREQAKLLMKKKENMEQLLDEEEQKKRDNYGKKVKEIPSSMWSLISNPVYIITSLGICCEISIVTGFIIFLPKYLETQYGISKSNANLLTGGIAIPGAVIGILMGGYLLKRFQLAAKGALQLTMACNFVAFLGFIVFFFLGCENVKMAGATLPYYNSTGHEIHQANLTSPCNIDCACSRNDLEPVCGINGITYFSPCHAGCTQFNGPIGPPTMKLINYTNCACILDNMDLGQEVIMSPLATSGPCKLTCRMLLPFMTMLFLMTSIVAGTQMPLLMITLRAVKEEERAFALGMQFVILRLFAYIPAPILFGNTIDSTCILWKESCGIQGSCLLYNIVNFRFKYIGVSACLKVIGMIFFLADWLLIKKHYSEDLKKTLPVGDIVKSVTSLASHGSEARRRSHSRSHSRQASWESHYTHSCGHSRMPSCDSRQGHIIHGNVIYHGHARKPSLDSYNLSRQASTDGCQIHSRKLSNEGVLGHSRQGSVESYMFYGYKPPFESIKGHIRQSSDGGFCGHSRQGSDSVFYSPSHRAAPTHARQRSVDSVLARKCHEVLDGNKEHCGPELPSIDNMAVYNADLNLDDLPCSTPCLEKCESAKESPVPFRAFESRV